MGFGNMFKDSNDINEKSVIGFMSFAVMVVAIIIDLVTGYFGKELVLNEYIYNSFVIITLGALGISGAEKLSPSAKKKSEENTEEG
jgi:hypothetical protein